MAEEKNVGRLDGVMRITLGFVTLGALIYYFAVEAFGPWYVLIPLVILVPFFLKTGYTHVCPVMKAMGVSTIEKEARREQ